MNKAELKIVETAIEQLIRDLITETIEDSYSTGCTAGVCERNGCEAHVDMDESFKINLIEKYKKPIMDLIKETSGVDENERKSD